MGSPTKKSGGGIPVGLLIIVLGTLGVVGLTALGVWSLTGMVKLDTIPVIGEWQAKSKPWRIELRADKTVVSSTQPRAPGAAQPDASRAWISEPGTYKVDYFGTLWVMLKSGKIYSASLAPTPGSLAPVSPDRIDLIEKDTESVTMFERRSRQNQNRWSLRSYYKTPIIEARPGKPRYSRTILGAK